jgi:hypothetical protein
MSVGPVGGTWHQVLEPRTGILTRRWMLGLDRDRGDGRAGDERGRVEDGEADEHASGDEE